MILWAENIEGHFEAFYKLYTHSEMCLFTHSTSSYFVTFVSYHQACHVPPEIAHGRYRKEGGYLSALSYVYECDDGYTLVGQNTITCKNSLLSSEAPQCKGN